MRKDGEEKTKEPAWNRYPGQLEPVEPINGARGCATINCAGHDMMSEGDVVSLAGGRWTKEREPLGPQRKK